MESKYFKSVDVLRAFAALSVLVYHVIEQTGWTEFPITGPFVWFRAGGFGVDMFFVISGFVVTHSALSLRERHGPDSWRIFAVHRVARLLPLYLVTGLVYLAMFPPQFGSVSAWAKQLITHLLFIHNWFPSTHGTINGVNWSVAAEVQFYLLIALLMGFIRVAPWWLMICVTVPIAWIWRLIAFLVVPQDTPYTVYHLFVFTSQVPGALDEFGFGIALALLIRTGLAQKIFLWRSSHAIVGCVAVLTFWLTMSVYWPNGAYWDSIYMVVGFKTLLGLSFALIVLWFCLMDSPALVDRLGTLRYLGQISYGLYLWHLPVIHTLRKLSLQPQEVLAYALIVTTIMASLSWHLLEQPIIRLGRRASDRRHDLPAVA